MTPLEKWKQEVRERLSKAVGLGRWYIASTGINRFGRFRDNQRLIIRSGQATNICIFYNWDNTNRSNADLVVNAARDLERALDEIEQLENKSETYRAAYVETHNQMKALEKKLSELEAEFKILEHSRQRKEDLANCFEKEYIAAAKKLALYEEVAKRIQASAGHPDASEGCRIVIKMASQALEQAKGV